MEDWNAQLYLVEPPEAWFRVWSSMFVKQEDSMGTTEYFVSSVILYFSKRLTEISMICMKIASKALYTSQKLYYLRDKDSLFSKLKIRISITHTITNYQYLILKKKI